MSDLIVDSIPNDAEIVFVSDMFVEDYPGGAELTTEALIDSSPFSVFKLHSKDVNLKTLESGVTKFWIFGNYSGMNLDLIPTIVANMKYSILEYDYKFCRYRSPEKHMHAEGVPCNCQTSSFGKIISAFMYGSKSLWWMSEDQMDRFHRIFPFLRDDVHNTVLSSVFDDRFFATIKVLKETYKNTKREGWIIVGSNSWIKGVEDSIAYCEKNNLEYEVVWNKPYHELLDMMARSEGMVFMPRGGDTCPRTVIEAKLLGCKLEINKNVQHAKEIWFDTDDLFDTEAYLYAARGRFWNGIKSDMTYSPTISGYTTTLNCNDQDYPFVESINSLLGFCNEVVVVDGGSTDGTWETILDLAIKDERIIAHQQTRDWDSERFAVFDGLQKALARSICSMDYCWQQDVDEIVHEDDYTKVKDLIRSIPTSMNLICLPVIEYWGGTEKVRVDVNPWKWRLSKNEPHITHGIPDRLRLFDESGNLFARPGTDGCDYIRNNDYSIIPFTTFYTDDVEKNRQECLNGNIATTGYENWLRNAIENLPSVYHYSWFNINRKIKTYKNYWSKHWQSLYNISQDDTPENNMFFDKPWSQVSEAEISEMSKNLSEKMGGWVFHSKVNFDKPTPHVTIEREHPAVMKDWIIRNNGSKK